MRNVISLPAGQLGCPTVSEPTIAAWVLNFSARFSDMEEWLSVAESQIRAASAQGADIFVMPEYVSDSWLSFAPPEAVQPVSEPWQAAQGARFLGAMQDMAARYEMMIVAGTFCVPLEDGTWRNRCHTFMPDGTCAVQDKLHLMPDERATEGLEEGDAIHLIDWNGLRIAIVICLDIQIPAAIHALLQEGQPDLVIIPSMTIRQSGFNRVFTCAAARAVELHCPVFVMGGVGSHSFRGDVETNVSGAALFIPCEVAFGMDGKRESMGPFAELSEREGRLFVAHDVPVQACRAAREDERCEAWYLPHHLKPVGVASVEAKLSVCVGVAA